VAASVVVGRIWAIFTPFSKIWPSSSAISDTTQSDPFGNCSQPLCKSSSLDSGIKGVEFKTSRESGRTVSIWTSSDKTRTSFGVRGSDGPYPVRARDNGSMGGMRDCLVRISVSRKKYDLQNKNSHFASDGQENPFRRQSISRQSFVRYPRYQLFTDSGVLQRWVREQSRDDGRCNSARKEDMNGWNGSRRSRFQGCVPPTSM